MALHKHLRPVPTAKPLRGPRRFPAPHNLRKGMSGTEHNGRFLLQQLLGCGGVCEVYAALDLRRVEWSDASPQVAVKRLLPELARNYQAQLALAQEFCILRHLAHPGVVRVFDLHNEPFGLCYSMELLQGRSAGEIRPGDLPGAALATMAARFFDALAFLHAQGIAHGDIKPANLLLKSGERPVLIDFNVAAASVRKGGAPAAVGLRESLRRAFAAWSALCNCTGQVRNFFTP